MDQRRAAEALERFGEVCTKVAGLLADKFAGYVDREDAEQEARILVLSYAGLIPGGRHSDTLGLMEIRSEFNEPKLRNLVQRQLYLDLVQQYGREAKKRLDEFSIDTINPGDLPAAAFDTRISEEIWLRKYPLLGERVLHQTTEKELARNRHVTERTIRRRMLDEKRAFLVEYVTRRGLIVEGDETLADLTEAFGYLAESEQAERI